MKTPIPPIKSEPEVSGAQIANHFNVGEATVRRWMSQGMPARKYNKRLFRYRLSEVEAWLQAREKQRAAQSAEATK